MSLNKEARLPSEGPHYRFVLLPSIRMESGYPMSCGVPMKR